MARKEKNPRDPAARVRVSDEKVIARLEENAPEVLTATMPEALFDAAVEGLVKELPSEEVPHFYCRKCGEYHLKTHAHYRSS
jgi:hypothetical protein